MRRTRPLFTGIVALLFFVGAGCDGVADAPAVRFDPPAIGERATDSESRAPQPMPSAPTTPSGLTETRTERNAVGPIDVTIEETVTMSCATENCFQEHFTSCTPGVTLLSDAGFASYHYTIIGPRSGGCAMETYYPSNPNPDWVGKKMTCIYDRAKNLETAAQEVLNTLTSCSGPLAETMRDAGVASSEPPIATAPTQSPARPTAQPSAAERITVTVRNSESGRPVPSVTIVKAHSSTTWETNASGVVTIPNEQAEVYIPSVGGYFASGTFALRDVTGSNLDIRLMPKPAPRGASLVFKELQRSASDDGGTSLTVTVQDVDGVRVPNLSAAFEGSSLNGKTDRNGRFTVDVIGTRTGLRMYFPELGSDEHATYYHIDLVRGMKHDAIITVPVAP